MKVLVLAFAFVALVVTERGPRNIFRKDLKVPFNSRRIPHKPSTRIVNGNEAVPHSIPWQVAVYISDDHYCGGSLIDEQNVMTAAQCLFLATGPVIKVVLGAHNLTQNEGTQVVVYSSDYLYHEQFDYDTVSNDIGLIRLESPVAFNEYIQPISVDTTSCSPDSDDYAGQDATVSGWGLVENYQETSVLREVTMPVMSNSECERYYLVILPTQLCTDTDEIRSICDGDGGGPLVLEGVQIGIASFVGTLYGCAGTPSGFTRVCKFSDWIEQNKKQ